MKRSILILGLGSFGSTLARSLVEQGNEVAVVDRNEDLVNAIKATVDKAVIADVTVRDALEQMGVTEFEAVVVSLGDQIDSSVLTTLHLKRMGARNIVVKGVSEDHSTVLKMIGADQVVFPERDVAIRLSHVLSNPNVLDHVLLAPGYSLVEMAAPKSFVGKTLEELDLRNHYDVQIVIIKQTIPEEIVLPKGDFTVKSSDALVAMGKDEDLRRVQGVT